jgi:glycosyltransferase EpsF
VISNKPTLVLQVSPGGLEKGGVQADIMYPIRILDLKEVKFDVLLFTEEHGYYENEFSKYGKIFRIPLNLNGNTKFVNALNLYYRFFFLYSKVRRILRENGPYDAIHCRNGFDAAPCLKAAFKEKIKVRIAHAHTNAPVSINKLRRPYHWISRKFIQKYATLKLGVTKGSLDYVFGKNHNAFVVKNPTVDFTVFNPFKFHASPKKTITFIEVGSIQPRKNQLFALEVFRILHQNIRNTKMIFIGFNPVKKGSYCFELEERIRQYKLEEVVTVLPQDADIAEALFYSDLALLPSITEGLPNTALEAQTMGLHCFLSSNITTETDCGLCTFLDLGKGPEFWANAIIDHISINGLEKKYIDMSDWDNRIVCKDYLKIWRGESWF